LQARYRGLHLEARFRSIGGLGSSVERRRYYGKV